MGSHPPAVLPPTAALPAVAGPAGGSSGSSSFSSGSGTTGGAPGGSGPSASGENATPAGPRVQYAKASYWDSRYAYQPAEFDWCVVCGGGAPGGQACKRLHCTLHPCIPARPRFYGWGAIRRLLHKFIPKSRPCLHVGCGNSNLQGGLGKSGYTVVNVSGLAAWQGHHKQQGEVSGARPARRRPYGLQTCHRPCAPRVRLQVDISQVVIDQMRVKYAAMKNLEYAVADCRCMPQYRDCSFASAIDKGVGLPLGAGWCCDGMMMAAARSRESHATN